MANSGHATSPSTESPLGGTHGLWEITAPSAPSTTSLAADIETDIAVIGAGYTGLSAALHLQQKEISAVVLEASEIGFGGSGRNAGNVNAGLWLQPNALLQLLGKPHGERLLHLLSEAPAEVFELAHRYDIACEPMPVGTLHCGVGTAGYRELSLRAEQWRALGAPVELLDRDETARRTGTSRYTGSLLDRRAGTIQPLAYARGLAHAALVEGARLYTQTPVDMVSRQGNRWRLRTAEGSVTADWVLVATNAYTSEPYRDVRTELAHLPYFNIATEPLSAEMQQKILPGREGAWDTKSVMTSFRMDQSGRLIIGSVGALRGIGQSIHRSWARRTIARLFPYLGPVAFSAEWYGKIGMTNDHLPRFHRFAPNVVGFSGYNGRGIGPGTVFGRVLSELVAGKIAEDDLPLPVTQPVGRPFGPFIESYYEQGASLAHLFGSRLPL